MNKLRIVLAILALLAVSLAGCLWWGYTELETPIDHQMVGQVVNVPPGTPPRATLEQLQKAGIIRHVLPLTVYIKLTHAGPTIKAGDYYFPSPITPREVLQKLQEGGQSANKLTIIEGWTRFEIATAMAAKPALKLRSANEALFLMSDTALIKDLDPTANNLEGYLFPDTYFIDSTMSAQDLIASAVKRFHEVWRDNLEQDAARARKSAHEVVTVASIIETEAKLSKERPIVASVIYNRLAQNIALSVDSTLVYAAKLAGKWRGDGKVYMSDIERVSPYNTRKSTGLPPGPVSSPGLSCMKAALHPANTAYIYYVRDPARNDGAHHFYVDAAGFERGVQALRAWEKHRDAGGQPERETEAKREATSTNSQSQTKPVQRSATKPAPESHNRASSRSNHR